MFDVFRKNQKTMLAALAILAMIAFIFTGTLSSFQRSQGVDDPVASTAWGKPIHRSQIYEISFERNKLNEFIRRAMALAKVNRQPQMFPTEPENIIAGIALAQKAEDLGISITDGEVMTWLNELTEEKLTDDDFQGILNGSIDPFNTGAAEIEPIGLSDIVLFASLKRELAIERLLSVSLPPPTTVFDTPLDVWERESSKITEISLKFVEIPVDKQIDASATPTDEQLKETYNQYAFIEADPVTGQPGFLQPRRIAIEYLVGKIDDLAQSQTVTDEEIAAYYEAHKDDFIEVPEPTLDTSEPEIPAPPEVPAPTPPTDGDESKPENPEPTPEPPAPTEEPSEPAPSEPDPQNPEPTEPAPETPEPKPESEDSSEFARPGIGRLALGTVLRSAVSLQQEETEPAAETSDEPSSPDTEPAPEEPAPPAASPEPAPADQSAPPVEEETKTTTAEPRLKPLEEVKEEIRQIIARQKAGPVIKQTMQKIIDEQLANYLIDVYRPARGKFMADHRDQESLDWSTFQPPTPPDFAKLATEHSFEHQKSGLLTQAQLDTLGALSSSTRVDRLADDGVPESFRQLVFGSDVRSDLYAPRISFDSESNAYYLYWKVDDQEPTPLPMDSVKDQLVELWRQEQARPKAKEKAEEILTKAKENENKLSPEIIEGTELSVQSTDRFPRVRTIPSGLTPGLEQPLEVKIANIPEAGEAFLDEVFALKQGDLAVLSDEPGKNFYVVEVEYRSPPDFPKFASRYRQDQMLRQQMAMYVGQQTRAMVFRQILEEAQINPPLFQPPATAVEANDEGSEEESP